MKSIINTFFDKVYVLNMIHEVDNIKRITEQFSELNIEFEFFHGVNGYLPEYDLEWNYYNKRPLSTYYEKTYNKKFITSRGAWGYNKTMIKMFKKAINEKYTSILVFDNDVIFDNHFEKKIKIFFESINDSWKILNIGASDYKIKNRGNPYNFYHPVKLETMGSFAVGYNNVVFPLLLDYTSGFESAFDNLPLGNIYEKYPKDCYVCFPNIVIADVRNSNIRDGRNLETHSKTMKWNLNNFIY